MKIKLIFLIFLIYCISLFNFNIVPNGLRNNNNDKIKDNYSLKENALAYSLFLGPLLYKYWGQKWHEAGVRADGEPNSIKEHLKAEFTSLWNIKETIKNLINRREIKYSIFKLLFLPFNNTLIRGALVYYLLPRGLHWGERKYKDWINDNNESTAEHIFLNKIKKYKTHQEFNNQLKKNDTHLSILLNQLIAKNPNIKYRLSKTIKNDAHNSTDNNIINEKAKKKIISRFNKNKTNINYI